MLKLIQTFFLGSLVGAAACLIATCLCGWYGTGLYERSSFLEIASPTVLYCSLFFSLVKKISDV